MREIKIEGCSTILSPDDKPAIGVFGVEGTGKSRFGATAPDPIGLIPLDKKSKRTFEAISKELGKRIVAPTQPLMSDAKARELSMLDESTKEGADRLKAEYTKVVNSVFELGEKFAKHPDIVTIAVDTNTQFYDWIFFSYFGRKSKIKPVSRAPANQCMIDFINMLRSKNLVLIHRSKEIWKDTGLKDNEGMPIQAPSGKFEQDGFKNIGGFLTVNCEMTRKLKVSTDGREVSDILAEKFKLRLVTCQTDEGVLLEGQELLSGEDICWDNLVARLGL